MCADISLFCGFAIPLDSLRVILFHAFAVFIAYPQVVLCSCMSLFCGLAIPLNCFRVILFYSSAVIITDCKIEYEI